MAVGIVNGKYLDGQGQQKEVSLYTWEEYQALPESEKMNGMLKAISGINSIDDAVTSDVFNHNKNYQVGDYTIYQNQLYRFTSNKSAGDWDFSAVVLTSVAAEIKSVKSDLTSEQATRSEAISSISSKIGEVPSGQTVEGQITSLNTDLTKSVVSNTDLLTFGANISSGNATMVNSPFAKHLYFDITLQQSLSTSFVLIATLKEGYRPTINCGMNINPRGNSMPVDLQINVNGEISIRSTSGSMANPRILCNIMFM